MILSKHLAGFGNDSFSDKSLKMHDKQRKLYDLCNDSVRFNGRIGGEHSRNLDDLKALAISPDISDYDRKTIEWAINENQRRSR